MSIPKLLIGIISLIPVSIFLITCSTTNDQISGVQLEITCEDFNSTHHFNQMLSVRSGETFEIKLCSNPTTGNKWSEESKISDTTVLKQQNHEFVGPGSEPPSPPGTPGQEIWTFMALKQGQSRIYLEYGQPWESGAKSEWTLTVDVIVN